MIRTMDPEGELSASGESTRHGFDGFWGFFSCVLTRVELIKSPDSIDRSTWVTPTPKKNLKP